MVHVCTRRRTHLLYTLSADGWRWSLLWQRGSLILLFRFLCRIFLPFIAILRCNSFEMTHNYWMWVRELAYRDFGEEKGTAFGLKSGWYSECERALGSVFVWIEEETRPFYNANNVLIYMLYARLKRIQLLAAKCWNMHFEWMNWFHFLQYASGDGNCSTLKKIGFLLRKLIYILASIGAV